MPKMKTLSGYEIVDAKAREDIEGLRNEGHALKSELPTKVSQLENDSKFITREEVPNPDLSEYITESELDAKVEPLEASIAAIEADCPETYFIDCGMATTNFAAASEAMSKFANKFMFGDNKEAIAMLRTPSSQYYYPAIVSVYGQEGYDHGLLMTPIAINPNCIDVLPINWETINLRYKNVNEWEYRVAGATQSKTMASKEYVDNAIANIDIPESTDLTGYATEEYVNTTVNTAISNVACVTEVLNVTALTETSQTLNELYFPGVTDILNRIANGEKFPFCLQTYNDVYVYPERLTPGLNYIVIKAGSEITNRTGGIYASYSLYKFERRNDIWYGYTEKPSTLIRSTNTEA